MIGELRAAGLLNGESVLESIVQYGDYSGVGLLAKLVMDIVVCGCLVAVAVIDFKKQIIPDKLNLYIFSAGACYFGLVVLGYILADVDMSYEGDFWMAVIGRLAGILLLPGIMLLVNFLVKGAFGGGDIKLALALAMAYGFASGGYGILLGILISGICGIILLITKRKKLGDSFALGPFLAVGMVYEVARFWFM